MFISRAGMVIESMLVHDLASLTEVRGLEFPYSVLIVPSANKRCRHCIVVAVFVVRPSHIVNVYRI